MVQSRLCWTSSVSLFSKKRLSEEMCSCVTTSSNTTSSLPAGCCPRWSVTELIDGLLVQKDRAREGDGLMTIGDRHRMVVLRLADSAPQFKAFGCFLQAQMPITIPPDSEPEPDISVVRGAIEDFRDHPPAGRDALFALEVADSSLRRDLKVKLPMYAGGGIPMYIVVNLEGRRDIDLSAPEGASYAEVTELRPGDTLKLPTATNQTVDVRSLSCSGEQLGGTRIQVDRHVVIWMLTRCRAHDQGSTASLVGRIVVRCRSKSPPRGRSAPPPASAL